MDIFRTINLSGTTLSIESNQLEFKDLNSDLISKTTPPGMGEFEIGPLTLSNDNISIGEGFSLLTTVTGENIGFIFFEIYLKDNELGYYYGPTTQQYIPCDNDQEIQDVRFPKWSKVTNIEFSINPVLRILTDGTNSAFAFMRPNGYGQIGFYLVGLLTRFGDDHANQARLNFDGDGQVVSVMIFKKHGERSVPHETALNRGDQFCPFVDVILIDSDESGTLKLGEGKSNSLIYNGVPFHWEERNLIPGDYLIGLGVQDVDGQKTRKFVGFTLRE